MNNENISLNNDLNVDVVVLGAGPGGYSAAFRVADLGKKVVLIERQEIGGVCLNIGCIPSKTLLHLAKVVDEAASVKAQGINFNQPENDFEKIRNWKNTVIKRLTTGLHGLAKKRKVELLIGVGKFIAPNKIEVVTGQNQQEKKVINFAQAIIATGSMPTKLPFIPDDPRVMDSTAALELTEIPQELLVIGGGVIGLEMATVYRGFGSKITVAEYMDQLLPGMDKDMVKPLQQMMIKKYDKIYLNTKVTVVTAQNDGLWVTLVDRDNKQLPLQRFDRILVTVGRRPCTQEIGIENIGVKIDDKGFVVVDDQLRTNVPNIYAIGDIVGNPMLAHKASYQGRLAAEIITDHVSEDERKFAASALGNVPSIVYTDPEVAVVGFSEMQLQQHGINYGRGIFPWAANGRSLGLNRQEGITKLLFDAETHRLLGAGIVGPNAGDLIPEVTLALQMQCTAEDIAATVHPHPTLSETIAMAAEVFLGTVTDL